MMMMRYDKIVLSNGHSDESRVDPGYNDLGLYDIPPGALDILCYLLIPHC
jgi:hypothetical protein